mmetsp:Transcript_12656/g.28421  ORF Transcript_12656/g.28421 Transcript_12656/m.28421 type:complete len:200 (-) Transcript_12656:17-616(-)
MPDPQMAVNTPPRNPKTTRMEIHQFSTKSTCVCMLKRGRRSMSPFLQMGMEKKRLFWSCTKLSRKRLSAKENQMQTWYISLYSGCSLGTTRSSPNITPAAPPMEQYTMARRSTRTPMNQMENAAAPMPTDCTRKQKSLATDEETPRMIVSTGKAMEPPAWQVAPATREPNTMVRAIVHRGSGEPSIVPPNRPKEPVAPM